MDESKKHINPNPYKSANFISKSFFWWMNPLFKTGYKRELEVEDLYNVVEGDIAGDLGDQLEAEWDREVSKHQGTNKQPSLTRVLIRCYGFQYMLMGILIFIEEAAKIVQPLMLAGFIKFFVPESTVSTTEVYLFALGISLCAVVVALTLHPFFFLASRLAMRIKCACCSLIYRKSLRLSNKALGETTVGHIVNLLSNDVSRIDNGVVFIHILWIGPVQAVTVLLLLWYEMGPTVLPGFTILILLIPIQTCIGRIFGKLRMKTAVHTDERVRVMNEIISGMRVIKMYCWEKPFAELVKKIRRTQLKYSFRYLSVDGLRDFLWLLGDKTLVMTVILPYLVTSPQPRTQDVFLLLAFIRPVQFLWLGVMFEAWQGIGNCNVSIKRITAFLMLDEIETKTDAIADVKPDDQCFVDVQDVTAMWDKIGDKNTLEKISASVKTDQLLAVIGPVGAGKTSLLLSILKELPISQGEITVNGKMAYASQQPWVFSASLRQNVTMGAEFDPALYQQCIEACSLKQDIDLLPLGDRTLIGDRGVNLSGGQRARVSLARALYTNSDIYLLDDPLSAVDAAVGRHIFEKCIQGVLRKKPRILVTHQVQYLTEADMILILKDGKIAGQGTYKDLAESGIDFASLLQHKDRDDSSHEGPKLSPWSTGSTLSLASGTPEHEKEEVEKQEAENRQEGTVGINVYWEYFRVGSGVILFSLLVLLNIVAQTSYVMGDWWLAKWSNEEEDRFAALQHPSNSSLRNCSSQTNSSSCISDIVPDVNTNLNIYILTGLVAAVFVFGLLRAFVFFLIAIRASQSLHDLMFAKILRAPVAFFDRNPVGRILNRFSKDVSNMDDTLPVTFFNFMQCFTMILGIVVVAGVINPWVFIPTVPLCGLFVIIRRYYLRASRSIKRLEGTTRSPVFSHLSASLQGLHTIRAFNMEDKFMAEFDAHQDLHTEAWFLFLSSSRWLAVRLDWLCALFVTAVCFCSILSAGSLDAGLVGLSITYAMTLMGMFQWGVRQSAEVENQMISVERVLEYSRLPTEAPLDSDPSHKPPSTWPQHGIITGEKACLKYGKTGPNVLKELNFCVRAQEKVGIVGRTGAGKSSLITMLFRLVEPKGKLMIDGVNILEIGLHDLRKTISIIPQDPVLFTGALRRNLDPFNHHQDPQLWKSLEEVELKSAIEELPGQLETEVSEGGINFSVGQRQLICLARAILRKNKILLIDEATANVDPKTDELIQATIRDKFRQCTVLTIAHRLHTIMDSDRVLVLDEGKIIDFDEPHLLLEKGEGHFYQMVQQTGKTEAEHLAEIALNAYKSRHQSETGSQEELEKIKLRLEDTSDADKNTNAEEEDSAISGSGSEEKDVEEDKESSPLLNSEEAVSQEDLKTPGHKSSKDILQSNDINQEGAENGRSPNDLSPSNDNHTEDIHDDKDQLLPSDDVVELGPSTPIVSIAKQKRSSRDLTDSESAATPLLQDVPDTTDTVDV